MGGWDGGMGRKGMVGLWGDGNGWYVRMDEVRELEDSRKARMEGWDDGVGSKGRVEL